MVNEIKLFYDLTAERTADEWYHQEILNPSIQEFVSLLPHNPRVLDLGCGPENESMRLHYAGADVLGIDFSKECILFGSLIHVAPELLPDIFFRIKKVLTSNGFLVTMMQEGKGINESKSLIEIEGRQLNLQVQ